MKAKNFLLISFLVIAVGLLIYGYFNAVPAPQDQAGNEPQIEITPESFNFGEIEYGQVAEHTFKVKNLGNQILEIKKVATSCACTSAAIAKESIEPDEQVDLQVEYDTGAMSGAHAKGQQERIIYIKSNDPVNPQVEVVITAFVK